MRATFTDPYILQSLRKGGTPLRRCLSYIYHESGYGDMVRGVVLRNGGSAEDAEDIFQEAVCTLVLNVQRGQYRAESSVRTYLVGIARNLHRRQLEVNVRRDRREQLTWVGKTETVDPEAEWLRVERRRMLDRIIESLGKGCGEVLRLWLRSFSIKEIAERTTYKNENVVSKKKHQCLQKLFQLFRDRPDLRETLR